MDNHTYLQRFKSRLALGIRIGVLPTLLVNSSIAILISAIMNYIEPSWDFTFIDGVYLSLFVFTFFILITIFSIILISSILAAYSGKPSNISAAFWGSSTGILFVIIGHFLLFIIILPREFRSFDYFYGQIFPYSSLPSIIIILILAFIGQRLNQATNSGPTNNKTLQSNNFARIETRGAMYAAQATCVGCVVLVLILTFYNLFFGGSPWPFQDSAVLAIILLGSALSTSLPFALIGRFLLGSIIKNTKDKGSRAKNQSIFIGALIGILTSTVIFMIAGFTCISYLSPCLTDLEGIVDILRLDTYYRLQYFLGGMIASVTGAIVGNRLFTIGSQ